MDFTLFPAYKRERHIAQALARNSVSPLPGGGIIDLSLYKENYPSYTIKKPKSASDLNSLKTPVRPGNSSYANTQRVSGDDASSKDKSSNSSFSPRALHGRPRKPANSLHTLQAFKNYGALVIENAETQGQKGTLFDETCMRAGFEDLHKSLAKEMTFRGTLDISNGPWSNKDVLPFLLTAKAQTGITGLSLRGCHVTDLIVRSLCQILQQRTDFLYLDVSNTKISQEGVLMLCLACCVHRSLTYLGLPTVRVEGLQSIGQVIQQLPRLVGVAFALQELPTCLYEGDDRPPMNVLRRHLLSEYAAVEQTARERMGRPGGPKKPKTFGRLTSEEEDETRSLVDQQENDEFAVADGGRGAKGRAGAGTDRQMQRPNRDLAQDQVIAARNNFYIQNLEDALAALVFVCECSPSLKHLFIGYSAGDSQIPPLIAEAKRAVQMRIAREENWREIFRVDTQVESERPLRVLIRCYYTSVLEKPITQNLLKIQKEGKNGAELQKEIKRELRNLEEKLWAY